MRPHNARIITTLLVEPTRRTGKEHGITICRDLLTGAITGKLMRGHPTDIYLEPCPRGQTLAMLHTHPHSFDCRTRVSDGDIEWADTGQAPICAIAVRETECPSLFL